MAAVGMQDWAKGRISPHKHRIWNALKAATKRYNKLDPDDRLVLNGRCTADVLNAFVIAEIRDKFIGVSGSVFVEKNNTTYHSLNGCVLWYKQLGEDRRPSNLPTLSVDQMMQGQFDFMPDQFLMVVGFELDPMKQKLKSVELQRYGPGQRIEFVIEIAEVVSQPPVTMPSAPRPTVGRRTKVEIRSGFEQKALTSGSE